MDFSWMNGFDKALLVPFIIKWVVIVLCLAGSVFCWRFDLKQLNEKEMEELKKERELL